MISELEIIYSVDGVASAITAAYKKLDYAKGSGVFISEDKIANSEPGRNDVTMAYTAPKASASYYGNDRFDVSLGQAFSVAVPNADTPMLKDAVYKIHGSLPVGITPEEKLEFFNRFRAFVASAVFESFVFDLEY